MAGKLTGEGQVAVEVKEDFGGLTMNQYLWRMTDKMHRQALRTATRKAGTELAAEIRRQIKRRDMPYSRARNAAERKKSRQLGLKPLAQTITTKPWSIPNKGIIGIIVGPKRPEGSHGHWVEFGHRIIGHTASVHRGVSWKWLRRGRIRFRKYKTAAAISRSGQRTIAHGFQQEANERVKGNVSATMAKALRDFVAKQERKGKVVWR